MKKSTTTIANTNNINTNTSEVKVKKARKSKKVAKTVPETTTSVNPMIAGVHLYPAYGSLFFGNIMAARFIDGKMVSSKLLQINIKDWDETIAKIKDPVVKAGYKWVERDMTSEVSAFAGMPPIYKKMIEAFKASPEKYFQDTKTALKNEDVKFFCAK